MPLAQSPEARGARESSAELVIKLRLVARQYLENPLFRDFGIPQGLFPVSEFRTDRGLLLEVELKGLAGIGSKVEALLRRSIDGYGEPLDLR